MTRPSLLGLPRVRHDPTQLVQFDFPAVAEGRQHVAQVDAVVGVPVIIRSIVHTRREHPVDHRAVSKDGQVEGRPVEGNEFRGDLGDLPW